MGFMTNYLLSLSYYKSVQTVEVLIIDFHRPTGMGWTKIAQMAGGHPPFNVNSLQNATSSALVKYFS